MTSDIHLRILIVEDVPTDAELAEYTLRKEGLFFSSSRVDTKETFLDALETFRPDLIISDYSMPQFDGMTALKLALELRPDLPFIMLTGATNEEIAVECMKTGAWNYVLKDRITRLPFAVKDALARRDVLCAKAKAEKALMESEVRYRGLFENSRDALLTLKPPDWAFNSGNCAAVKMFGTKDESDLISYKPADLSPRSQPDGRNSVEKAKEMTEIAMRDGSNFFEWAHKRINGEEFTADVLLTRVEYAGQKFIQASIRDITERKSLELQFRHAQKMETIGRLSGGVAHDFNNLLTVITGHSEMALAQVNPIDPLYFDIQSIQQAADRAAGLTRQLLAFSRKQVLEPKIINMNSIIQNLMKMITRLIGENISVKFLLDDHLSNIKADPGQIEQVIVNLSVNARDAMPEGGEMTISTRRAILEEGYSKSFHVLIPGEYAEITITDTGCGMHQNVMERIFDPFFTTKEVGRGTGLGLSTVFGFVKQSGGYISVESEVGKGSTFKIFFPCVKEAVDAKVLAGVGDHNLTGTEKILVVEDDANVRGIAVFALKKFGYEVITASSGGEALLLCENMEQSVDLVLTDVVMPGMTGAQFVAKLRYLWPDVKALYMSGYTDEAITHEGVLDPGIPFIGKPFKLENLLKKVREVLGEAKVEVKVEV